MAKSIVQAAGRGRKIADIKNVALYEPHTGRIVHMHTVVAFQGGRVLTEKEATEQAHRQAARDGKDLSQLKTKVSSKPEHALGPHRIDIATGEFVALKRRY